MDMLVDIFNAMQEANEQTKEEKKDKQPYQAVPTPVVEHIFLLCSRHGLPSEVRYLSVELFDRFVALHYQDLHSRVWKADVSSARDQWNIVQKKVREQTSLRILSCIQLASKFVLHSKSLKPKEIQAHLMEEGREFNLKTIFSSEMRVWKTLKFRLHIPTVKVYVDLLFERLRVPSETQPLATLPSTTPPRHNNAPQDVLKAATLFTDSVYLQHHEIYKKLFYLTTGRWDPTPAEKKSFRLTECDMLYRASAVVALSLTLSRSHPGDIYLQLGELTQLLPKDIEILANVIHQVVLP